MKTYKGRSIYTTEDTLSLSPYQVHSGGMIMNVNSHSSGTTLLRLYIQLYKGFELCLGYITQEMWDDKEVLDKVCEEQINEMRKAINSI